jgi:hypothetical protein
LVRQDVGVTELLALLLGASRAVEGLDPPQRTRTVAGILDGLRAR